MPTPSEAELSEHLAGALAESGLIIEQIKLHAAGSRRKLTVVVDLADESSAAPVSLNDISRATSVVEETLDPDEVFAGKPYTLEITSPGAVRELSEPRHFRRSVGRRVKLSLLEGAPLVARLREVGENDIEVHDEKADELLRIPFSSIDHARVELEFK